MVQNPPSMTGPIRSRRRRPHPIDDGCVGVAGPQRRDMSHTRPSVPGADARCAENSPPGPIRGASGWSRITIGRLVAVGCSGTAARPPRQLKGSVMTMPDPQATPFDPKESAPASDFSAPAEQIPAPEVPAPEAPSFPQSSAPDFDEATATPGSTTYGTAYDAAGAQSFPGPEQPAANQAPFGGAPGAQPSPEQPAYGQQATAIPPTASPPTVSRPTRTRPSSGSLPCFWRSSWARWVSTTSTWATTAAA